MKPVNYFLKFHKDFLQPIQEDIKVSTIRDSSKPLEIGDVAFAYFYPDEVCLLRIDNHYAKKLKDITEEEAKREGYLHPDFVKHELKDIYPNLQEDDYVYIYQFTRIKNHRATCLEFLKDMKSKGEGI